MFAVDSIKFIQKAGQCEYEEAIKVHGPVYNTDHEAMAVMFEEIEETETDLKSLRNLFKNLWQDVKHDESKAEKIKKLENIKVMADLVACEAMQVAGVVMKYIETLKKN